MRHTYVHTTFQSELRFMVNYACAYCGAKNGDENFLHLKGDMPGKVVCDPNTGAMRSLTAAQVFAEQLQQVERGDVRSIRLNARCRECGKMPAWAHYPRKSWHIVLLVFGILAGLFALSMLRLGISGAASINWVFLAGNVLAATMLIFLSLPLYKIRCSARDKKIAALTSKQMP